MTTIATKLQVGAAACAIAGAATLVPVAAQAAPEISAPTAPVTQVLDRVAEFNFFWFSTPNPNPPPRISLPTLDVPIISALLVGLGLGNKEICVAGVGVKIGMYGGITASVGLGC